VTYVGFEKRKSRVVEEVSKSPPLLATEEPDKPLNIDANNNQQGNYSDSGSSSVSQDSTAGDNAIANAIWHNLERLIVGYHLKRVEKGLLPPLAQECLKALYQERMRNKLRLAEIDCKDLEQVTDVLFRGKRSYSRKAGKLNRRHRIYDRTQIELAIHLSKKVITPLPCLIRKVTAEHRKPQIVSKPQQPQAKPDMTAERAPIPRISTNREISDFFMGPKDAIDEQEFTDEFNECFVLESWNPSFFYALLKTNLEEGGLVKQVMFSLNQFYLANNDREDLMINETFPGLVGMYVAAMYCEDGEPLEWHRAQIFAINNLPKVTVNYVDYGTEGQVCLSNLRLLPKVLAKAFPYQAVKLELGGIHSKKRKMVKFCH